MLKKLFKSKKNPKNPLRKASTAQCTTSMDTILPLPSPEYIHEENRMNARILTDLDYAAKKERENIHALTDKEHIEYYLLRYTKNLNIEFYNYPFKLLTLAKKNEAFRDNVSKLYTQLHSLLPLHHQDTLTVEFNWEYPKELLDEFEVYTYEAYITRIMDLMRTYTYFINKHENVIRELLTDDLEHLHKLKVLMKRMHDLPTLPYLVLQEKLYEAYPELRG